MLIKCSNKKCSNINPQLAKNFYKNNSTKNKLSYCCKDCDKKRAKEIRNKRKYYYLNKINEWKTKNPHRIKIHNKKRTLKKYNITQEFYKKLMKRQHNKCGICLKSRRSFKRDFSIDHNHLTKKIRGLLCSNCNTALGLLKADKGLNFLYNAIKYIKNSRNC